MHAKKRKGGAKEWFKLDPDKVQRISLSEEKFEKAVLSHGMDIVRWMLYGILLLHSVCELFASRNERLSFSPLAHLTKISSLALHQS